MDNMEGKAPPTPKRRAKPKTAVNILSEAPQDEPQKKVVKSRAKPKTAVNVSDGEAPPEEPQKKGC